MRKERFLQLSIHLIHTFSLILLILLCKRGVRCLDPYQQLEWVVSYLTVAPLGVQQQVIAINGQFPGPTVKATTNDNMVINVRNELDEDFLITWNGIQQRRTSWQDGVTGTNCGIPSGWNWTYNFQVKDQIGSYFYFPSLGLQKVAGGFGGFTINNRVVIPVPFNLPDGDITILIGDWYVAENHKVLRQRLDRGQLPGIPDGVLINGKGPYPYGDSVPRGVLWQTFNVDPGKTYRLRVSNVGFSTCLNFRIQNHDLLLVETEGSYVVQQMYSSLDIHVGQSYSFLVTMDEDASSDYYVVASARFTDINQDWSHVTGVAILHYSNSMGPASGPLPPPPNDQESPSWSIDQARSIRWNLTAGAARPNPQGSFHYGQIAVTQTIVLRGSGPLQVTGGAMRYALNGVSYVTPTTPLKLADYFNLSGVYTLDSFPKWSAPVISSVSLAYLTSVITGGYKSFMEIVFENPDSSSQSYHMDGYAFFVVGFGSGVWSDASRASYNLLDAVARSTTQVFPNSWTAVLVELDNVGMWNIRSQLLPHWYLGQELYLRVFNPENNIQTEAPLPDNTIYCGLLASKQKALFITKTGSNYSGVKTSVNFVAPLTWMFIIHLFTELA